MKLLIQTLTIILLSNALLASESREWTQIGDQGALRKLIEIGYTEKANHEKVEKELEELIHLSLITLEELPSPRVQKNKEWVIIDYSVTTEFTLTSESFGIRANFKDRKYEVVDVIDEGGFDLGIRSNQNNLGLFDNESLFATMKHTTKDGKASIEVVNLWK